MRTICIQERLCGPNIPIKDESGNITGWFSPKGVSKQYIGSNLHYQEGGAYWDKKMLSAEKAQLLDEMADYFRKRNK